MNTRTLALFLAVATPALAQKAPAPAKAKEPAPAAAPAKPAKPAEAPAASPRVAEIKKHAELCAKAQIASDFPAFIPYMPKKLVEFMGGKEAVEKTIRNGTAQMKEQGISFETVTIGTPDEPKVCGPVLAGIVPQKIVLNMPDGRLVSDSALIAISEDSGKTWVFVDAARVTDDKLDLLYPGLGGKITIPARTQPKMEKK